MLDRVIQALLPPRSYCDVTYSTIIDLRERMFHLSFRAFAVTRLSLFATLIPRPQNVRLNAMFGHPEFDLFEAIYTTRSMRRLKPDPGARELVMRVIDAATLRDSGSDQQDLRFIDVSRPGNQHV